MRAGDTVLRGEIVPDLLRVINKLAIPRRLDCQAGVRDGGAQHEHRARLVFLTYQVHDYGSWPGKSDVVNLNLLSQLRIETD